MFADVLLALPLGTLLAFTIGPVFFVLLETAITKGFRAAVAFDAGVLLADATFILIVYFTTSSLLREIKDDPKLFFVGGLIMMAYGIISFIKLKKDFKKTIDNKENAHLVVPEKVNYIALFIKGFLLNFINIGVLGFWLGSIIVLGPKLDMNANRILIFFIIFCVLMGYKYKKRCAKSKESTPFCSYCFAFRPQSLVFSRGEVILIRSLS